jgi:hypothetical protein
LALGKKGFLAYNPDVTAVANASRTGAGGGKLIGSAGAYYSTPTEIAAGGISDVSDLVVVEGALVGTLEIEVSNTVDAEIAVSKDRWAVDDTVALPDIANDVTNRVVDTDDLEFIQGTGSTLSARLATDTPLPACTASGSGVGKTLTASANAVLTVDGVAVALNDNVLVKDQANKVDNGLYKCTTAGAAGAAFVLTRSTSMDATGECVPGTSVAITTGTVNGSKSFVLCGTPQVFGISRMRAGFGWIRLKFTYASGQGQISSRRVTKAS